MDVKLTVIVPMYNAEKYIKQCVDSVLGSTDKHLELIVVNDGSTDGSVKILSDVADRRLRIINKVNEGVSVARNIALQQAQGQYILFLDADDYFEIGAIEQILKICSAGYDAVIFNHSTLYSEALITSDELFYKSGNISKKNIEYALLCTDKLNSVWGKIYKRSIACEHSVNFDPGVRIGEDVLFNLNYFSHCNNCLFVDKPFYVYRQHGNSAMHKYRSEYFLNFDTVYKQRREMFDRASNRSEWELEFYQRYFSECLLYLSLASLNLGFSKLIEELRSVVELSSVQEIFSKCNSDYFLKRIIRYMIVKKKSRMLAVCLKIKHIISKK